MSDKSVRKPAYKVVIDLLENYMEDPGGIGGNEGRRQYREQYRMDVLEVLIKGMIIPGDRSNAAHIALGIIACLSALKDKAMLPETKERLGQCQRALTRDYLTNIDESDGREVVPVTLADVRSSLPRIVGAIETGEEWEMGVNYDENLAFMHLVRLITERGLDESDEQEVHRIMILVVQSYQRVARMIFGD